MRKGFSKEKKAVIAGLLDAGESQEKVAATMECSRWMVRKVKAQMAGDGEFVRWYKANRADILAKVQMDNLAMHEVILSSVTPEMVEGMSANEKASWLRNTAVNAGIMYDKERLENDLSTENLAERLQIIMQVKREDEGEFGQG